MSSFGLLVQNSPETPIQARIATRGRIEYYYKVFGGVTVLFIEVQSKVGSGVEHLNQVAQVIAECDGGFVMNVSSSYKRYRWRDETDMGFRKE